MWVAKQMGHADWTMIARVYGRWMPTADLKAGHKAVEKFAKKMLARMLAFLEKNRQKSAKFLPALKFNPMIFKGFWCEEGDSNPYTLSGVRT